MVYIRKVVCHIRVYVYSDLEHTIYNMHSPSSNTVSLSKYTWARNNVMHCNSDLQALEGVCPFRKVSRNPIQLLDMCIMLKNEPPTEMIGVKLRTRY
jgi:hypothetical protein